ncbi:hypothetical protein AGMMS49525_08580 [Bacteroidia bacterium]|nr:hypothetical protein AGMMS49525_08580 [Bacteroidia bacterium]
MELIWIIDAKYVNGYKIALTFNDGVKKTVDLTPHLYGEVFEPLKDINNFKNFYLSDWSVEWENGADMAPEFLYCL